MLKLAKIVFVQMLILCAGLAVGELALRFIAPLPVPGGAYLDRAGNSVSVAQDELSLRPLIEVTHIGPEFAKTITTNSFGYRKIDNESPKPDVVFIGDSFTFGHGVADAEVFSSIYCRNTRQSCQNLGRSGSFTFVQNEILRRAIEAHGMRPKTVILVMLAACWIESSGNDLGENLQHLLNRSKPEVTGGTPSPPAQPGVVKRLQHAFGNYELVKRAILAFSAQLKRGVYQCSDDKQIDAAVKATQVALNELDALSKAYDFRVKVFVIHPFQELAGGHKTTEAYLRAVMPASFEAFFTAGDFQLSHYYPYDGHFNVSGHANMAAIIERSLKSP